jgi:hypothetical protein
VLVIFFRKKVKTLQTSIPEGCQESRVKVVTKRNLKTGIRIWKIHPYFQAPEFWLLSNQIAPMNLKVLRVLSVFILFILLGEESLAQQVLWEKVYNFGPRGAYGDKIVQLEDSSYAAISRIAKFGYKNNNLNLVYGLALIRLNPQGDTLFVRPLYGSSSGTNNALCRTPDSRLLMGVTIFEDTVFSAKMRILKCNYSVNI